MDLGKILDGPPEPPSMAHTLEFFTSHLMSFPANSDGDYCLPVPMTEFQRQLSDEVVSLHYSDILRFYEQNGNTQCNQVLANSLQALCTNSQLVASHPFLLVNHYMPTNLLLKGVPNQLIKYSGKFTTLVNIIDLVRDKKMEIALVSRPGKSIDILEALLVGKMINYQRHSGSYLRSSHRANKKHSRIHLISSTSEDSKYTGDERFDLVIAFDSTFEITAQHIEKIRSQSRTSAKDLNGINPALAPVIRLIPYYSAEHIAFKFKEYSHDEDLYMQRVVAAIVILRGRVGTIPIDLRPYYAQGIKFLEPWLADLKSVWPLPPIPEIEFYSAQDVENSLLTEVNVSETKQEAATSVVNGNGSSKETGANGMNDAISQSPGLSNEINGVFSEPDEYFRARRIKREVYSPDIPETALSFMAPPSGGIVDDRQVLTHKILRLLETAIEDLSMKNSELESLRTLASSQQSLHDETVGGMNGFLSDIRLLEEKIQIYERKAQRHEIEMNEMRELKNKQAQEIEEAREKLMNKIDGSLTNGNSQETIDFAVLETQRERISEIENDLKKAKDQLESRTTEHEYMRVEYQKASSAMLESAEEANTLKSQNAVLESKVKAMIDTMKNLSFDAERQAKDAQVADLEAKLIDVQEQLKNVSENEKMYPTRSRYGMRSSSGVVSRRANSPSTGSSRPSSVSDREGSNASTSNGPHPLQNMTNS